jgi:hypothetical protein
LLIGTRTIGALSDEIFGASLPGYYPMWDGGTVGGAAEL